jgi:KaiC/GvpD/RAD55 family RecA-like ATPase
MRVKTYIKGFDEKIEGGFPQPSSIMVFGPPGSGKTTFCNQFIYNGLKIGEAALYITLSAPPTEIKDSMKKFGWKIEDKIIVFIDAYSWKLGGKVVDKYTIKQPSDSNEFNIKVSEAIREYKDKNLKRGTIDSFIPSFSIRTFRPSIEVYLSPSCKLKLNGITHTVVVESGMHDKLL